MVFELVLIAIVLGSVGFAVYHSSQKGSQAPVTTTTTHTPTPDSSEGIAVNAANLLMTDAAADAATSAEADSIATEATAIDSDISTLGGSSDDNSF